MSASNILVSRGEGVTTITFNRPEKKNAFTLRMYEDLVQALDDAERDTKARVVVLKGAGGSFTSGNDLADFMSAPPEGEDSPVFRFLLRISDMRKPVIAAVEGAAIGLGTTMLLHVDLVYAADNTTFQFPFVTLGLVPEGASSYLLPRGAGFHRANEVLLFGERFGVETAREIGIVNRVVRAEELARLVEERAARLASLPPPAVAGAKKLIREGTRDAVKDALRREGELFVERLRSPEAAEAFLAFFEKRKPDFSRF